MSVHILSWAFKQRLPDADKLALMALANYADIDGTVIARREVLLERCGLARDSFESAVTRLIEAGYVTREAETSDGSFRFRLKARCTTS